MPHPGLLLFPGGNPQERRAQLWSSLAELNCSHGQITALILCAVELASLVIVATDRGAERSRFSLAAAMLNFLVGPAVVTLSHLEHVKSVRPSFLLSAYLFTSLLLDVAVVRTRWLQIPGADSSPWYAAVLTAGLVAKAALLALETVEKRRLLVPAVGRRGGKGGGGGVLLPSLESTSGPFNRGLFVWLNGLLMAGYASLLTPESLPSVYEMMSTERPWHFLAMRAATPFVAPPSEPKITVMLISPALSAI